MLKGEEKKLDTATTLDYSIHSAHTEIMMLKWKVTEVLPPLKL